MRGAGLIAVAAAAGCALGAHGYARLDAYEPTPPCMATCLPATWGLVEAERLMSEARCRWHEPLVAWRTP